MPKTVLIHKHKYKCGGIGDFIRSALSFYALSQRFGYEFYIDLSDNTDLQQCFIIPPIPSHVQYEHTETLHILDGIYSLEKINPILEQFKNNPKTYILYSNAIGYEPPKNISYVSTHFFKNILKPSQIVIDNLNNLYLKNNLQLNNYVSVHIRCGDKNMQTHVESSDNRLNINDDNNYKHYHDIIQMFKKNNNITIPIIIHSDSTTFKQKFVSQYDEYKILDIYIQHISENIGNNNINSYVSTISEFYMIANANKILLPDIYSGFSHIASLINNKPLYTNFNNVYFEYCNMKNIMFLNDEHK